VHSFEAKRGDVGAEGSGNRADGWRADPGSTAAFAQITAAGDRLAVSHNGEYTGDPRITPFTPLAQTR
jgi:hypothetical protein